MLSLTRTIWNSIIRKSSNRHRSLSKGLEYTFFKYYASNVQRDSNICTPQTNSNITITDNEMIKGKNINNFITPTQSAFLSRIGFQGLVSQEILMNALYHPSQHRQNVMFPKLVYLGANTLKFFVNEYIFIKYPKLSLGDLKNLLAMYTDKDLMDAAVKKYGTTNKDNIQEFCRQCLLALIGALVLENRNETARIFIHHNFTHHIFERSKILTSRNFKGWLFALTQRLGRPIPAYRLEGETGRKSNSPMFIVGVYSGCNKLGEAYGPSITLAETRAARDALERYYLEEEPQVLEMLPSNHHHQQQQQFKPIPIHDTPAYP